MDNARTWVTTVLSELHESDESSRERILLGTEDIGDISDGEVDMSACEGGLVDWGLVAWGTRGGLLG